MNITFHMSHQAAPMMSSTRSREVRMVVSTATKLSSRDMAKHNINHLEQYHKCRYREYINYFFKLWLLVGFVGKIQLNTYAYLHTI